jgi:hypothetical protein
MNKAELSKALEQHMLWLLEKGGERANLSRANLRGADLRGANLREADLSWANLSRADLYGADLRGADLREADLYGADLRGASLRGADLRGADLRGADLRRANLRGADLREAKLPHFQIQETGRLIGYKKLRNDLVAKIAIPAKAKRTANLINRKRRAEYVKTLKIYNPSNGTVTDAGNGEYDGTLYTVGDITRSHGYDDDIRLDCAGGIHFWTTEQEAIEW